MASSLVMFLRCNQFSIRVQFLPVTGRKCGGISSTTLEFFNLHSGICDIKISLPPSLPPPSKMGGKRYAININCELYELICKNL